MPDRAHTSAIRRHPRGTAALAAVALAALALHPVPAGSASDPLRLPGPPAAAHSPGKPEPAAAAPVVPVAAAPSPAKATLAPPAPLSEAQKYCQNVAAAAADARFAWQSKKIGELEAQIKTRVGELEAKQAEYKIVLDRYDEAMKRAKGTLVDIYGRMRPETAATQLSVLDDATAAAVLMQLNPQKASAILNEIAAERAAKIVTTMTSLGTPAAGSSATGSSATGPSAAAPTPSDEKKS